MLTLYHSPRSRSSRVIWLLEELGADYEIAYTDILHRDGSGAPDPKNPHPDKKVPALVHDNQLITESAAIFQYLTELYPQGGMGPGPGEPGRGAYLTWLAYYAGVFEPVTVLNAVGLGDNLVLQATFRGRAELDRRLLDTLDRTPYLLGDKFSAVDILYCSAGQWFRSALPEGATIEAYLASCQERPALARAREKDAAPKS